MVLGPRSHSGCLGCGELLRQEARDTFTGSHGCGRRQVLAHQLVHATFGVLSASAGHRVGLGLDGKSVLFDLETGGL